jgi:hypothetical protein
MPSLLEGRMELVSMSASEIANCGFHVEEKVFLLLLDRQLTAIFCLNLGFKEKNYNIVLSLCEYKSNKI